jgi:guanylate kinase
MKTPPPLIILTGPSGAGKSTVAEQILSRKKVPLRRFVTCTTRPKRPGERSGRAYWFMTREAFEHDFSAGLFYESAEVYGNLYGSSSREMDRLKRGRTPILMIIDVQGMKTIKTQQPDAFVIFLDAPKTNLQHRLEARNSDPKDLKRRMAMVAKEERLKRLASICIVNEEGNIAQTVKIVEKTIQTFIKSANVKTP